MTDTTTTSSTTIAEDVLFEEPYKRLLPTFMALGMEELAPINVDITSAVATALGAHAEIDALVPQMERELPGFELSPIRELDDYAMALSHAHTLHLMASQAPDARQPLVAEGTKLREILFTDASALAARQLVNGKRLKDLQGAVGYKHLAVDLQILAALLREGFADIEGKSAVKLEELQRADQIAAAILRAVGAREQRTADVAATSDIRSRAFTMFVKVYDQARRAVSYLRWNQGDAEAIAPSLYAGRTRKKSEPQPSPSTSTAASDGHAAAATAAVSSTAASGSCASSAANAKADAPGVAPALS